MDVEERGGLTRRTVVKRAAVGGAVVWTAPAIFTVSRAAAGGTPSCRSTASLSGLEEVPPNASPASGQAIITIDLPNDEICWDVTVTDLIGTITAAHIHVGPVGVNGPIVQDLSPPVGVTSAQWDGCAVDATLAAAICANPGAYYVNVHTTVFAGGEVRGQLA